MNELLNLKKKLKGNVVVSGYARLPLFDTVPSLYLAEHEVYRCELEMRRVVWIVRAPATKPATKPPSSIVIWAYTVYSSLFFYSHRRRFNIREIK